MTDDAAQLVGTLEDGDVNASAGQEGSSSQTSGATADDSDLLASHGSSGLQGSQNFLECAGSSGQLSLTDLDVLVVVVTHALVATVVGANGTGDEGQSVTLQDDVQSISQAAFANSGQVSGDVLLNGAAVTAGSIEAVNQGNLLAGVTDGQGLDGLLVQSVGSNAVVQSLNSSDVQAVPALVTAVAQSLVDLSHTLVSAGLQDGGSHGDGPNACIEQSLDVTCFCAAGVGDTQLAVELVGDAAGQGDGQGVQGTTGHVHLAGGQLASLNVDGEGVGQLQTELDAFLIAQGDQTLEHGDSVAPLQVFHEVAVSESDVAEAQGVQALTSVLVAQQSGVALDVGVQVLLGDQVGSDCLDFCRGAAVQSGLGDGVGDASGDGVDVVSIHVLEHVQMGQGPVLTCIPDLGLGSIHHVVDVGVGLVLLDVSQVVANGHVEDKAVGIAHAQFLGHQLQGPPCLDVLGISFGDPQLGGPFAVVAFVACGDAGAVDACAQVFAVHLLNGLQLEEAGACCVSGHDVLGQLGVRTCGGAVGSLDLLVEDGQSLTGGVVDLLCNAEDGTLFLVLSQDPGHQLTKGDGTHNMCHVDFLQFFVFLSDGGRLGPPPLWETL